MIQKLTDEFDEYDQILGNLVDREATILEREAVGLMKAGKLKSFFNHLSDIDRGIAADHVVKEGEKYGIKAIELPLEDGYPDEMVQFLTSNDINYTSEGPGTLMIDGETPMFPGDYLIACNKEGRYVVKGVYLEKTIWHE